jgi:hypothetical protein
LSALGSGCRELGDDEGIDDEDILWRRVPPWAVTPDGQPDSSNFVDKQYGELSVALADLTSIEVLLRGHEGFGVVSFTAGDVRKLGDPAGKYVVRRAPLDDDAAHTVVCPKLSRGDARKLADACKWAAKIS